MLSSITQRNPAFLSWDRIAQDFPGSFKTNQFPHPENKRKRVITSKGFNISSTVKMLIAILHVATESLLLLSVLLISYWRNSSHPWGVWTVQNGEKQKRDVSFCQERDLVPPGKWIYYIKSLYKSSAPELPIQDSFNVFKLTWSTKAQPFSLISCKEMWTFFGDTKLGVNLRQSLRLEIKSNNCLQRFGLLDKTSGPMGNIPALKTVFDSKFWHLQDARELSRKQDHHSKCDRGF